MLIKIMDILAGLKMTIVSGIFLLCAVMCMVSGIESPIDPAWGAVIISGIPLFYLALYRLIFEKWVSSALLITIAMVASLVIGEIFAAAEVAWIMALGALLEDWTVERAKKGLKNLIELTPQTGRLICNENGKKQEKIISVDEIKIDDVLRVLPGEKIPVDGIVIDGDSSIDQSVITGESLPVDKSDGDEVFCGTLNMYGVLDIKTTSLSENSSLQKLIDLVKQADEKQAPTQRIADKWATWLVPVALIIAAAAWVATGNIERGVTVLVVFCPCALILATPTAVMAAIGQATKHGILIKSGEALENLGELNTITFDKTGTLTYGDLKVSDIIPTGDFTENEVLAIASAVENLSEHPLAKAIADKAIDENIAVEKVSNFKMYPGRGVFGINSKGKIYAGNLNYIKENFEISDKTNTYLDNLNSEGKAILPFHLAKQIQWLCSHPPQLFTLQDDLWIIEVSKEYLDYVICNGGTIRTDDGRVFHCCIGQYEGFHLKTSFSSQKRVIPMKFPVCSKSVHFLSFLYWSFSRNPLVYIPFFVVISNQILVSY